MSLKDSFNGMSLLSFMFCMSQHKDNGPESFCTMNFADQVKNIRANVIKPKKKSIQTLIRESQSQITQLNTGIDKLMADRKAYRQLMIKEQQFNFDLYQKLLEL